MARRGKDVMGTIASLGIPAFFHFFFVMIAGSDSDGAGPVLVAAIIAAASGGLFAGWRSPFLSLASAVALPALAAWTKLYWKMGVSSPAAAAPAFVKSAIGLSLDPIPAYALTIAACLLPGWLFARAIIRFKLVPRGALADVVME